MVTCSPGLSLACSSLSATQLECVYQGVVRAMDFDLMPSSFLTLQNSLTPQEELSQLQQPQLVNRLDGACCLGEGGVGGRAGSTLVQTISIRNFKKTVTWSPSWGSVQGALLSNLQK